MKHKSKHSLVKLLEVCDISIFLYQISKQPSPILVDILNKRLEYQSDKESDLISMDKLQSYSLQLMMLPVSFDIVVYKCMKKLFTIKDNVIVQYRQMNWSDLLNSIPVQELHQNVALLLNTHLSPNPKYHEGISLYCLMPFMMMSPYSIQDAFNFPKLLENKNVIATHYLQMEQKLKIITTSLNENEELSVATQSKFNFYSRLLNYTDTIYNSLSFFSNIPAMVDVLDMQLFFLKAGLDFNCLASPFHLNTHLKSIQYLHNAHPSSPSHKTIKSNTCFVIVSCTPSNEFLSSAHEKPYVVYYECIALQDLDQYIATNKTVIDQNPHITSHFDMMQQILIATHLYKESKLEHQEKVVENLKITVKKWKECWRGLSVDSYADLSDVHDRKHNNTFADYLFELSQSSPYSNISSFHIIPMLHKPGDLRQERMALQLLQCLKDIFHQEHVGDSLFEGGLASGLSIYEIICCNGQARVPQWLTQHPDLFDDDLESFGNDRNHGLIELCLDTTSVHKVTQQFGSFSTGFGHLYGKQISGAHYKFLFSLVAYSIATYLFNIKDRHNNNILLHKPTGKLIHIDFGFFLNLIPGTTGLGGVLSGGSGFEQAPFKLTTEYIEILGGIPKELQRRENRNNITTPTIGQTAEHFFSAESLEYLSKSKVYGSSLWTDFMHLMQQGFKAVKKHHRKLTDLVHLMETSADPLPCFTGIQTKSPELPELVSSPLMDHQRFSPEMHRSNSMPSNLNIHNKHYRQASSPLLDSQHSLHSLNSNTTNTSDRQGRSTRSSTRPSSRASSITKTPVTDGLRERCMVHLTDEKLQEQVSNLIDSSIENVFTLLYDQYQRISNGIL